MNRQKVIHEFHYWKELRPISPITSLPQTHPYCFYTDYLLDEGIGFGIQDPNVNNDIESEARDTFLRRRSDETTDHRQGKIN